MQPEECNNHDKDDNADTFDYLIDRLDEALVFMGFDQMMGLDDYSCSAIDTDSITSYQTSKTSPNCDETPSFLNSILTFCGLRDTNAKAVDNRYRKDKESSSSTINADEIDRLENDPNIEKRQEPKEIFLKDEMDEVSLVSYECDSLTPHNWQYTTQKVNISM